MSTAELLHRDQQGRRQAKGFSLLDTLIAMAVLTVGVLGVIGTFPAILDTNQHSWGNIQAITLAEDKMEQIRQGLYGIPMSTNCTGYTDHAPNYHANYHAFHNATRTWCAQPAPPDQQNNTQANLQWVYVQVQWLENGQLHTVKLDNYLSY